VKSVVKIENKKLAAILAIAKKERDELCLLVHLAIYGLAITEH